LATHSILNYDADTPKCAAAQCIEQVLLRLVAGWISVDLLHPEVWGVTTKNSQVELQMATTLQRPFDFYFVHLNTTSKSKDIAANINCARQSDSSPCGTINFYRGKSIPGSEAAALFGPWSDPDAVYITLSLPFDMLQPTLQMLGQGGKWQLQVVTNESLAGKSKVKGLSGSVATYTGSIT
jgi:hypothetical protein